MNFNKYLFLIFSSLALNLHADQDPALENDKFPESIEEFASSTEEFLTGIEFKIQDCRRSLQADSNNNPLVLKMFDKTVKEWKKYKEKHNSGFDLEKLLEAISFAASKHQGQIRKDEAQTPYIIHPIGVARILWKEGKVRNINVLTAALLHDTLEDTETTGEEIESLFGERVRYTVEELSNDPNLTSAENKQRQVEHAPHLTLNAQLVKLADRLYNVRDLRNPPPSWTQEHITGYLNWGDKLLKALSGTNEALEKALKKEIKNQLSN